MTEQFKLCHARLGPIEGWAGSHSADRGGLTVCGVARNFHPDEPLWQYWDSHGDKKALITDPTFTKMVAEFYYREFWQAVHGDLWPMDFAWEMFEFSVNAGVGGAVMHLQTLLNCLNAGAHKWEDLPVGGKFGERTKAALAKAVGEYEWEGMAKLVNMMQFRHYINLTLANPSQEVFTPGWVKKRILYI